MKFIPSIIARNKKELVERFSKVESISKVFQLDIMDSKFVKNKSLMFDFELPKNKKYEVHLMIKDPYIWIQKNWNKGDVFLIHIESLKGDFFDIKYFLRDKGKKMGIVINPRTSVEKIRGFLPFVDRVTIMSVMPGRYGAKFLKNSVNKSNKIREINSKVKIQFDGGINEKTIQFMPEYVDSVVLGSYLQDSFYPEDAIKLVKKEVV